MFRIIHIIFTIICFLCCINSAFAFKVSPFKLYLASEGNSSRGNFVVDNNTEITKAINIYILKRDIDENAKELNEEIDGDFSIYPSQLILRPGEKQDVRIQYLGDSKIYYEHAYRLIAEELPLDFIEHEVEEEYRDKPNGGVGITLTYSAALYVSPPGSKQKSKLLLHCYKYDKDDNAIIADIENIGNVHIVLRDSMLQLHSDGSQKKWNESATQYIGSINMLANRKTTLKIPLGDEKFDNITLKLTP